MHVWFAGAGCDLFDGGIANDSRKPVDPVKNLARFAFPAWFAKKEMSVISGDEQRRVILARDPLRDTQRDEPIVIRPDHQEWYAHRARRNAVPAERHLSRHASAVGHKALANRAAPRGLDSVEHHRVY